jgi:hypothetical protein
MLASTALVMTLVLSSANTSAVFADSNRIDLSVEQFRPLQPCADTQMLDCIEDAGIEHVDGSKSSFTTKEKIDYSNRNAKVTSASGFVWSAPIETSMGAIENFEFGVFIRTKARFDVIGQVVQEPGIAVSIKPQGKESATDRYYVTLRTSWLQIYLVSGIGTGVKLVNKKIQDGHSISISGLSTIQYWVNNYKDAKAILDNGKGQVRVDVTATTAVRKFEFFLQHFDSLPRKRPLQWGKCIETGFPATFANGQTSSIIYAEGDLKSTRRVILGKRGDLVWFISSPHFTPEKEVIEGTYQADVPVRWLDCAYPSNEITKAQKIEMQIIDEFDGIQVATSSVKVSDGILIVRAFGFHYSTPHFRVYNAAPAVIPTPQKIVITCKKGLATKIVSGAKPACPKGYKKA